MCYTAIIKSNKKGIGVGELGYWTLLNMVKDNENNNDGYAIRSDDFVFRTLKFNDFLKTILAKKEKIMGSEIVHLHMRLSTNTVSEEFIHMWNIGGYYCSHNGILHNTLDDTENDSLKFFQAIKKHLPTDNLKKIKNILKNQKGYGIFLMSKKNSNKIIVASYGKELKVYKVDGITIFSSNKLDFEDFKNTLVFEVKLGEKKWLGFTLEDTQNVMVDVPMNKSIVSYLGCEKENFVQLISDKKICRLQLPEPVKVYSGVANCSGFHNGRYFDEGYEMIHPAMTTTPTRKDDYQSDYLDMQKQIEERAKFFNTFDGVVDRQGNKICIGCDKILTEDNLCDKELNGMFCSKECMDFANLNVEDFAVSIQTANEREKTMKVRNRLDKIKTIDDKMRINKTGYIGE